MALATILQKLLSVQTRFSPILTVFGPNDLEGQGQISPYAILSENIPRYTYKPNLVILATFFQKLLSLQAKSGWTGGRTDGPTDAGDRNTPRPYWPRGKNGIVSISIVDMFVAEINLSAIRPWYDNY